MDRFADLPDHVGAGKLALAGVGGFVDVDDAQLDAARDGVESRRDEAFDGWEAFVEEAV